MESATALWAAQVAEATILPDGRLNKRLAMLLDAFASDPQAALPQAWGSWAAAKAAYRFLDNKRFRDDSLLAGLCRHTAEHACLVPELLVVQDTTSLNFTRLRGIEELGPIDSSGLARGLLLHSCLAVSTTGRLLGLLSLQAWVRPLPDQPKPDAKESGKWLYGIEQARLALAEACADQPLPRLIHVMDREGDCLDVLQAVFDAGDMPSSVVPRTVGSRGRWGWHTNRCVPKNAWA